MLSPPLSALVGAPVFLSVSPLSFVVWFHFPFKLKRDGIMTKGRHILISGPTHINID